MWRIWRHEEDDEIEIIWINSIKSKDDLSYEETLKRLKDVYEKCHPTNKTNVLQKIQMAEKFQGETLFDILIGIVKNHENNNLTIKLE